MGSAYRSGTGTSVGLSISSIDTRCHWDMNVMDDIDLKWYQDSKLSSHDRAIKGFDRIFGRKCIAHEEILLSAVDPRTCGGKGQGSREWFLDRAFSGTSSTIYTLLTALANDLSTDNNSSDSDNDGNADDNENIIEDLKTVLKFCDYDFMDENLLEENDNGIAGTQDTNNIDENTAMDNINNIDNANNIDLDNTRRNDTVRNGNSEDPSNTNRTAGTNIGNNTTAVNETANGESEAVEQGKFWVEAMTTLDDDGMTDDKFKTHLEQLPNTTLLVIMGTIKGNNNKNATKVQNKKKLLEWIQIPRERRKYQWLLRTQLDAIAAGRDARKPSGLSKDGLIDWLISNDKSSNEESDTSDGDSLDLLAKFIDCSLLQPMKDKVDRSAASIGHSNEQPFIHQFINCCLVAAGSDDWTSEFSFSPFGNILSFYRPGLVQKKNKKFAKGSADGICFHQKVSSRFGFIVVIYFFLTFLLFLAFTGQLTGNNSCGSEEPSIASVRERCNYCIKRTRWCFIYDAPQQKVLPSI